MRKIIAITLLLVGAAMITMSVISVVLLYIDEPTAIFKFNFFTIVLLIGIVFILIAELIRQRAKNGILLEEYHHLAHRFRRMQLDNHLREKLTGLHCIELDDFMDNMAKDTKDFMDMIFKSPKEEVKEPTDEKVEDKK